MAKRKDKPIVISPEAAKDILQIIGYLSENWTDKVVQDFLNKLETFYSVISINPRLFGFYDKQKNIRKYIISKHNILLYQVRRDLIDVIAVFDARLNPLRLKKRIH